MTFIQSCIFNQFLIQQRKKSKHPNKESVTQSILQLWQSKKELVGGPESQRINTAALCCTDVNAAK